MRFFERLAVREIFMTVLFFMAVGLFVFCFREWYLDSVVPEVEWNREAVGKVEALAVVGEEGERAVVIPTVIAAIDSGEEDKGYIYYDLALPKKLQEYTQDVCAVYSVPFELALAVMYVESRYQIEVDNGLCVGLFQINLDYAQAYYDTLGIGDIREPRDNILSGVWYLSELMGKYDDLNLVLMHYNIGNNADKYWADGVRETEYTKRVIAAEMNLKKRMDIVQEY